MKPATLAWIAAAAVLSGVLFEIKHAVQDGEERLVRLNREVAERQDTLRVLKAEWSHLNQPARLARLAGKHLGLEPVRPAQIVSAAGLGIDAPTLGAPKAPGAPKAIESGDAP